MTPDFDGETYERERDQERLGKQLATIRTLMLDAKWRSLSDIRWSTGIVSEASISARLRDLRKSKFGGYTVERQYAGDGLWEYRVLVSPLRR